MYVIKSNRKTNSYTVRKINRTTKVVRVGRRGLKGDPGGGLVESVNGKQGVVVLNAADVGADPAGSASQALADAKYYTDGEVSTLDSSLATVAKTGSYNDLSDKPTIPSIAGLATEAQVQDVQDNLDAHEADTANPHNVTKAQVGLGDVANLAPADMPVSTATQTALNAKANATDTVNLTGNQTVAGVKTFSSSPVVPTATTNTQAVNKAQMDTADALKVNKAGDTMTGDLTTSTNLRSNGLFVGSATGLRAANFKNSGFNARLSIQGTSSSDQPGIEFTNDDNTTRSLIRHNQVGIETQLEFFTATDGALTANPNMRLLGNGDLNLTGALGVSGVGYLVGTGFPNGVVSAPVGSTYIDKAATNGAIEWKKATGAGNTGWVVSVGDTGWRDISSILLNGWTGALMARRIGGTVYIQSAVNPSAMTSTEVYRFPVGLRSTGFGVLYSMSYAGATGSPVSLVYRTYLDTSGFLRIPNATTSFPVIHTDISVPGDNSWPTTLPGTAV